MGLRLPAAGDFSLLSLGKNVSGLSPLVHKRPWQGYFFGRGVTKRLLHGGKMHIAKPKTQKKNTQDE